MGFRDIEWWRFKPSYMWNDTYHLRRSKFVAYQLTPLIFIVSKSLGSKVLSDYTKLRFRLSANPPSGPYTFNDAYIGIASFDIFVAAYASILFNIAFLRDLFRPERRQSKRARAAWRACSAAASFLTLVDIIGQTVIVVTTRAYTASPSAQQQVASAAAGLPAQYTKDSVIVTALAFLWIASAFVIASTVLMWISIRHNKLYGPFASHRQPALELAEAGRANGAPLGETSHSHFQSGNDGTDSSTFSSPSEEK